MVYSLIVPIWVPHFHLNRRPPPPCTILENQGVFSAISNPIFPGHPLKKVNNCVLRGPNPEKRGFDSGWGTTFPGGAQKKKMFTLPISGENKTFATHELVAFSGTTKIAASSSRFLGGV